MTYSWLCNFKRVLNRKKHVFVMRSSEQDNLTDLIDTFSSKSAEVDIYSTCKDLFMSLNKCKNHYELGVVYENDKKNISNILIKVIQSINPKIRVITYSNKNSSINKLFVS